MKHLMRYAGAILLCSGSFGSACLPDETGSPEHHEYGILTEILAEIHSRGTVVGFAVAIVDQAGLQYSNGFGFADRLNAMPYSETTFQPIASISKTILGVSLMKAQELGILSLDDPINDYLPFPIVNPHHPDVPIRIRHLATHTASLHDTEHYEKSYIFASPIPPEIYTELPWGSEERKEAQRLVETYNSNVDMPLADFLCNIYCPEGPWYSPSGSFRQSLPGSRNDTEYSNNGAAIASLVVEGASGMSYIDFVDTYVTGPLGMNHSGWDMADFSDDLKSKLYPFGLSALPDYKLITLPDGGFVTNVQEFSIYLSAMMRGYAGESDLMLTAASYQEMFQEGIFWDNYAIGPNTFGHSGGDPGVSTFAFFDPVDLGKGYIYFSNTMTVDELEEVVVAMILHDQ